MSCATSVSHTAVPLPLILWPQGLYSYCGQCPGVYRIYGAEVMPLQTNRLPQGTGMGIYQPPKPVTQSKSIHEGHIKERWASFVSWKMPLNLSQWLAEGWPRSDSSSNDDGWTREREGPCTEENIGSNHQLFHDKNELYVTHVESMEHL